jgi:Iap family predicted aminopeptidase
VIPRDDRWRVAGELDADTLIAHAQSISQRTRISGSSGEAAAFDYIETCLSAWGYRTSRFNHEALIGYPQSSSLEIHGHAALAFSVGGYSLSPSTPPGGITGDLVSVSTTALVDGDEKCIRGKIALVAGLPSATVVRALDASAAAAAVFIDGPNIREMCISPVWGSPIPETLSLLPRTPSIGISERDGTVVLNLLSSGPLKVTVHTTTVRDWTEIPLLVATLGEETDPFVLFSGHVDSWYHGAMDNGTANAVQLAVARVVAQHEAKLARSIRFAFWSGHSHGRYAGSSWFADNFWHELYDQCVCHVNVDSVGAVDAEVVTHASTMSETFSFAAQLIREETGQELEYCRIAREGDQSFWGIGVPSLFEVLSTQKDDLQNEFGWWWHTMHDTMDKIDSANLLRDARIYLAATWDLLTLDVLPFDYCETAREIRDNVARYQTATRGYLDLGQALALSEQLESRVAEVVQNRTSAAVNRMLVALGRALIPVLFTERGPFDQDLALPTVFLPGLSGSLKLNEHDAGSDQFHALLTKLVRERNRLVACLRTALAALDDVRVPPDAT